MWLVKLRKISKVLSFKATVITWVYKKITWCILPILLCRIVKSCVCKGWYLIKLMILYSFIQTFVCHWLFLPFLFSLFPSFFFLSFLPSSSPPLPPFLPLFLSLSYPKCLVGENTLMLTLWATPFEFSQKFYELYLYCLCTLGTNINTVKHINNASVFSWKEF